MIHLNISSNTQELISGINSEFKNKYKRTLSKPKCM